MTGGPRAEQDDKEPALWGVGVGRAGSGALTHEAAGTSRRDFWSSCSGKLENVCSRVTGFSVFVWSVIPGVYVGFSFLARARGKGGGRERGWS